MAIINSRFRCLNCQHEMNAAHDEDMADAAALVECPVCGGPAEQLSNISVQSVDEIIGNPDTITTVDDVSGRVDRDG